MKRNFSKSSRQKICSTRSVAAARRVKGLLQKVPGGRWDPLAHHDAGSTVMNLSRPLPSSRAAAAVVAAAARHAAAAPKIGNTVLCCWSSTSHGRRHRSGRSSWQAPIRIYSINAMRARHRAWFREDLERLFGLLATGAIRPRVAGRNAFDEVAEAHRRLEAGGLDGKLVLCPEAPP